MRTLRRGRTERVLSSRYEDGALSRRPDELIVEEPMTIQLDGVTVSTTMRTPGNDFELAAGFCFTEGLLGDATVTGIRYCGGNGATETEFNVVGVETGGRAPAPTPRLGTTSSSCGLCGADAIDDLRERIRPLPAPVAFDIGVLAAIPARATPLQELFATTGSVHAAATFGPDGTIHVVREDIGRHNAVDKVTGRLLLDGRLPAPALGLYVSGRASFEIVAKAWAAQFSAVIAVSAPSSLAVDAARAAGLTLAGFARGGRVNVYARSGAS